MKIQVLGPGCDRSRKLAIHAERAARELGLKARVEEISDPAVIAEMGVFSTPALVVDGQVKATGRVVSVRELKSLLDGL